jgi:hypothetical protein
MNNQTSIYARVTVDGKRANIRFKHKVDVRSWDAKRQKTKGNNETSRILNQYLDQLHSQLFRCFKNLKLSGKLITAELIKAHYLEEGDNTKTLQELLEYQTKNIEKRLAIGTQRNFGVTQGYINKCFSIVLNTSDVYLNEFMVRIINTYARP